MTTTLETTRWDRVDEDGEFSPLHPVLAQLMARNRQTYAQTFVVPDEAPADLPEQPKRFEFEQPRCKQPRALRNDREDCRLHSLFESMILAGVKPDDVDFPIAVPAEAPGFGDFTPSPAEAPGFGDFTPSPAEAPGFGDFTPSPAEAPGFGEFTSPGSDGFDQFGSLPFVVTEKRETNCHLEESEQVAA